MKLRVRLTEVANVAGSGHMPISYRLAFTPNGEEDAQFVAIGTNPGRHIPVIRLAIENLEAPAIAGHVIGGEYLLTLEPVAKR